MDENGNTIITAKLTHFTQNFALSNLRVALLYPIPFVH